MPAAKDVGEPCAGEPHARFEVAAGGIWRAVGNAVRALAPPADPTVRAVGNPRLPSDGSEHARVPDRFAKLRGRPTWQRKLMTESWSLPFEWPRIVRRYQGSCDSALRTQ
jgi:hypothetical protein